MQKMNLIVMTLGLLTLAACASTPTHQAPGEYVDDATITTKVKSALIANPVAKAHEIEVETFRGVVQLSGFVDTTTERDTAQKVAQNVGGVKSVHNNIEVRSEGHSVGAALDDTVVTTRVKSALVANPVTKAHEINVATANGVVLLSGFVDSADEKTTAAEVARRVEGVRDVRNELETKPAS